MMSLVRSESNGIRRYFSPYLASALLMLFGGYQLLYQSGSNPYRDVLYIFGTQLSYNFLLALLAAYLYRKVRLIEDAFLLLAILGFFILDLLFIQHLYGWSDQTGMLWAISNCAASLVFLCIVSFAFGLNMINRLTITVGCIICFLRLGPRFLVEAKVFHDISFSYVFLGWLLALTLLPLLIFAEPKTKDLSLPMKKVEKWVLCVTFAVALIHFVISGNSFSLPFLYLYIAPFVALLPLVLHRFYEFDSEPLKKISIGCSVVALFLAASNQSIPIFNVFDIREGPFTPFWFTLLAISFTNWRLSTVYQSTALMHFSALTLSFSFLGGNLSEVLVNIFYPQTWHILFVTIVCFGVSYYSRSRNSSILLNVLPSLLITAWLGAHQIPFGAGFIMATAISILLVETTCRIVLARHLRLMLIVILLMFSLFYLFIEATTTHKLLFIILSSIFMARGILFHQPHYLWPSVVAASVAAIGYPLAIQSHSGGSTGRIFIQLSFILLVLGFGNSIYGGRIKTYLKRTFGSSPDPQT